MAESESPHKVVDAECCPTCRSRNIVDDPEQAGEIYQCAECGHRLTRMRRENIFGGDQYYYVDVQRAGLRVHTKGKNEADE